ncbi:hypothetical protein ACFX11_044148 [Malus domestica]
MASSKGQAVLATTEGRILSTSAANRQSIGATTAPQHAISKLVPLKEQGEHQRCRSVINLTSLGASKHVVEAHQMTSQSGQRGHSSTPWMPEESRIMVAQVTTIDVTSIEEQLAQMNEAIARLTWIVEEKNLQIAALVIRLEQQVNEVSAISELQNQMANFTTLLSQVVEGPKVQSVAACGVCSMQGHLKDKCHQLIENGGWESANAVGFGSQHQPSSDLFLIHTIRGGEII